MLLELLLLLNTDIRKAPCRDKRAAMLQDVEHSISTSSQLAGSGEYTKKHTCVPYHIKDARGRIVPRAAEAQVKADFLAHTFWGYEAEEIRPPGASDVLLPAADPDDPMGAPFTRKELRRQLRRAKNNKAPGPDGSQIELYKNLSAELQQVLLDIKNRWAMSGDVPVELTKAEVAMIHKKGDTGLLDNFKPISPLNVIYKLYAAMIQHRLQQTVD